MKTAIFILILSAVLFALLRIFLRRMEEVRFKERNIFEKTTRELASKRWYVVTAEGIGTMADRPGFHDKASPVVPCGDARLEGAYIVDGDLLKDGEASGTPYVKYYYPEGTEYRKDPGTVTDDRGNVYKPAKP